MSPGLPGVAQHALTSRPCSAVLFLPPLASEGTAPWLELGAAPCWWETVIATEKASELGNKPVALFFLP